MSRPGSFFAPFVRALGRGVAALCAIVIPGGIYIGWCAREEKEFRAKEEQRRFATVRAGAIANLVKDHGYARAAAVAAVDGASTTSSSSTSDCTSS